MSYSQDVIRDALTKIPDTLVFKPADDNRNWKPCDYMVWWRSEVDEHPLRSAWVEVKQTSNVGLYTPELRPSQHAAMVQAHFIGLPYILAVYWEKRRFWTLIPLHGTLPPRMSVVEAETKYGVGATPGDLSIMLRSVLNGEAGL